MRRVWMSVRSTDPAKIIVIGGRVNVWQPFRTGRGMRTRSTDLACWLGWGQRAHGHRPPTRPPRGLAHHPSSCLKRLPNIHPSTDRDHFCRVGRPRRVLSRRRRFSQIARQGAPWRLFPRPLGHCGLIPCPIELKFAACMDVSKVYGPCKNDYDPRKGECLAAVSDRTTDVQNPHETIRTPVRHLVPGGRLRPGGAGRRSQWRTTTADLGCESTMCDDGHDSRPPSSYAICTKFAG